jgi:hypothetical protein
VHYFQKSKNVFIIAKWTDNVYVEQATKISVSQVVGRNRFPSLNDRPQLHYTNAVLLESLRAASLVPPGINLTNLRFGQKRFIYFFTHFRQRSIKYGS